MAKREERHHIARHWAVIFGAVLALSLLVPVSAPASAAPSVSLSVQPGVLTAAGGVVQLAVNNVVPVSSCTITATPALVIPTGCPPTSVNSLHPFIITVPSNASGNAITYFVTVTANTLSGKKTLAAAFSERPAAKETYVALGDSYSAGQGNPESGSASWADQSGSADSQFLPQMLAIDRHQATRFRLGSTSRGSPPSRMQPSPSLHAPGPHRVTCGSRALPPWVSRVRAETMANHRSSTTPPSSRTRASSLSRSVGTTSTLQMWQRSAVWTDTPAIQVRRTQTSLISIRTSKHWSPTSNRPIARSRLKQGMQLFMFWNIQIYFQSARRTIVVSSEMPRCHLTPSTTCLVRRPF